MCPTWADKLPDWLVAAGTLGAVVVALWQSRGQREESASRVYYEQAANALRTAVEDFSAKAYADGTPVHDRRHWLTFARGLGTARHLAAKIQTEELKYIWKQTEHYWRERVYDLLRPERESLPAEYYGYDDPAERYKNFVQDPNIDRTPLAESSLVVVYRWIHWPEDKRDTLDRGLKFSEAEIERMETFGPRGLARYIRILREGPTAPPAAA